MLYVKNTIHIITHNVTNTLLWQLNLSTARISDVTRHVGQERNNRAFSLLLLQRISLHTVNYTHATVSALVTCF